MNFADMFGPNQQLATALRDLRGAVERLTKWVNYAQEQANPQPSEQTLYMVRNSSDELAFVGRILSQHYGFVVMEVVQPKSLAFSRIGSRVWVPTSRWSLTSEP